MNHKIKTMEIVIIVLSIFVILTLTIYTILGEKYLVGSGFDTRASRLRNRVQRGTIYDRSKNVLSYSEKVDDEYVRKYNYPSTYAHINGYVDKKFGVSGLEKKYDFILTGVETKKHLF